MPSEIPEAAVPEERPERPSDAGALLPGEQELLWGSIADDEEEAAPVAEEHWELLGFVVGGEEYAVGISEVQEIIRHRAVTLVPRCPAYLLGVITLRGEIVPVLDLRLRLRLGNPPGEGDPMVVIVRASARESAGLLVERIVGLVRIAEGELEPTPDVLDPGKAEYFRGVVRTGERLVTILDIDRVLRVAEDFGHPAMAGPGEGDRKGSADV